MRIYDAPFDRRRCFIIIDTLGTDSYLMRLAHSMANLIAPLNESFVDFDAWRRRTQRRAKSPASPLRRNGARGAPLAPFGRRRSH
jgi:ATPase MipZ